jgi:glycosyltransferase involved in cell wall biosynthesis
VIGTGASASTSRPVRVLQVFTPAPVGGLESVLRLLAPGLKQAGAEVAVTAVMIEGTPEPESVRGLEESGVTLFRHRTRSRRYWSEHSYHRSIVDRWRPDVVHTHGYRADVLAGRAVGNRAPRVATVHGFTGGDWKNRCYEWLQTRGYRDFARVIAVSRSVRDRLRARGVKAEQIELISNAYAGAEPLGREAAREVLGLPRDARVIGWVGRLSPEKGPDVLLRAVAALADRSARLSIVGNGPMQERLAEQAARLGIAERLTWHGQVGGAGRLMKAFDAFVLSSRTEGTPIALFEAMAAGVPIVTTAVGGVPDVIDATTGWLVPSDAPERLAGAIGEVLGSPAETRARAARAQARLARDFAVGPWIERHLLLYRNLREER